MKFKPEAVLYLSGVKATHLAATKDHNVSQQLEAAGSFPKSIRPKLPTMSTGWGLPLPPLGWSISTSLEGREWKKGPLTFHDPPPKSGGKWVWVLS